VKLFGATYKIRFAKTSEKVFPENGPCSGTTDQRGKIIHILKSPKVHQAETLNTYFHELIHAIDWHVETKLKEQQVNLLALGFQDWALENGVKIKIE
jgi:hypothetical protein